MGRGCWWHRGRCRLPAERGARRGSLFQDPGVMTWAKGRHFTDWATQASHSSVLLTTFCNLSKILSLGLAAKCRSTKFLLRWNGGVCGYVSFHVSDIYYDCSPKRVELVYTSTRKVASMAPVPSCVCTPNRYTSLLFHVGSFGRLKLNHFNYFITVRLNVFFLSYLYSYEKTRHNLGLLICKCLCNKCCRCFLCHCKDQYFFLDRLIFLFITF